ncbi:protein FAM83H-like isoform X2 [Sinocyclocheilus grahami]|uniref:protein FAM83H-like isoform X2 n=1 Tax=Sinocyclocheilus grahami TaxID=75366 RepID=UPI0007AC88F6|nr:PREDICTED: protein FAM83H-like isoform X2 [Sinocyclocheilus grahami]
MLQRSSRLRSSLIFSSSKLEQHSSSQAKSGGELQEEKDESEPIRYSSIVAELLEKRRSLSREPFDWNKHKKAEEKEVINASTGDLTTITDAKEEPIKEKEKPEKPDNPEPEDNEVTQPTEPLRSQQTTSSLNINDPASRLQYFKDLEEKRKNSKLELDLGTKSRETAMKKPNLTDTATTGPNVLVTSVESSVKIQEPTITLSDPVPQRLVIATKPSEVCVDRPLTNSKTLTESTADAAKKEPAKEPTKSLRPFPSPKFLKPFKASQSSHRRISCGEDILTDATDAEKSELKKSRSFSSSGITRAESKESLSSLNLGNSDGKDTKALDFLKKQTQRLKGFLGPKGEKKHSGVSNSQEDKSMKTVPEIQEEPSDKEKPSESISSSTIVENNKPNVKPTPSRYQSSTSNVIFSSNLRDDTKVILEQISANSQKNRQKTEESGKVEGGKEEEVSNSSFQFQNRNRFSRTPVNPQERDNLLKRIESMRKEKKVYSRFEVLYRNREECCWDQGNVEKAEQSLIRSIT